jgi:hypothetical protein
MISHHVCLVVHSNKPSAHFATASCCNLARTDQRLHPSTETFPALEAPSYSFFLHQVTHAFHIYLRTVATQKIKPAEQYSGENNDREFCDLQTYQLAGVHPDATNAVLSMAKEGVNNAVANLPQALQSFQQAQGSGQPQGFGAVLSGLQNGLQGLIGGPETTVETVPNSKMTQPAAAAVQSAPMPKDRQAILSGNSQVLATAGEGSSMMSDAMFQAGVRAFCYRHEVSTWFAPGS